MSLSGTIEGDQIKLDRGRGPGRDRDVEMDRRSPVPAAAVEAIGDAAATLSMPALVDVNDPNLDERTRVVAALEQAGWVQAKAARLLGMTPRQIAYRIQTLNIEVKQF